LGNVVEIKKPDLSERVRSFDEKAAEIRDFLSQYERCGFVIVAYARTGDRDMTEASAFSVDDAMDSYALPEMAKMAVIRLRESS